MSAIRERLTAALADRYRIERELGQGGMATVYLAEDLKHKRRVAVKVLKPELAAVLGAERFVVEITTTAALQHPHILPLFDSGEADGFLYYVMPFIDGETLRAKLDRETQLGVDEAVKIASDVASALHYAHTHGVIHRDIKPENILLHDGRPMVADFGIALAVSAAAGGRMTETGLSLGTPHYMSPEQATAEKEISARSDVYSLGSVLYEMLTGQPPHLGGSAQQIIMKIITEPAELVTKHRKSVPANVAAAVAKSLEKLPADRFASAKAFAEALGDASYTNVSMAGAVGPASAGHRGVSVRLFAVTTTMLLAVAAGAALWGSRKDASSTVVSRQRIVLWDNQRISAGRLAQRIAISPDGATIVFIDSTSAGTQLFAKERDRLDATALAGTVGIASAPTFSPDGAWIAFVGSDGTVKKIPRTGGSAITIGDSSRVQTAKLAWLESGSILYRDTRDGIRVVGPDGGPARTITGATLFGPTARTAIGGIAGLPSGKAALLIVCRITCTDASELRVLDLRSDSTSAALLVDEVSAAWSLPGGVVAFVRRDGGVFAAPFDLKTLTFSRPPMPIMDGVRASIFPADMTVSAGGSVMYVPGSGTNVPVAAIAQPVWVTRSGATMAVDTAWTASFNGDGGNPLGLSPDGRRLAVAIDRPSGVQHDIWIKQLDRAPFTLTKLTFEGDNVSPAWSADGQTVFYTSGGVQASGALRRRRSDATGPVDSLLTLASLSVVEVVVTPDTTRFLLRVLALGSRSRDIVAWQLGDSTTTNVLASPTADETNPTLSPDGRWLAYASTESGRYEVYVSPYPDVRAGRWQVSQGGGVNPRWAHSGRELFYRNNANALVSAAVLPGATFTMGAQTVLFSTAGFVRFSDFIMSYTVAPDDKRFVFLRSVGQPGPAVVQRIDQLVQVTNWGAEVQAKLNGKSP